MAECEEEIDLSDPVEKFDLYTIIRPEIDSPSHDSNSSGVFSPDRTVENELDRDADFDSSGEELFEIHHYQNERRKLKRRTSSNVFTFKKYDDDKKSFDKSKNAIIDIDVNKTENVETTETCVGLANNNKQKLKEIYNFGYPHHFCSSTDEPEDTKRITKSAAVPRFETQSSTSTNEEHDMVKKSKKATAVDGLLFEIYDRYNISGSDFNHIDSDLTECSTTSVTSIYVASSFENDDRPKLDYYYLERKDISELEKMVRDLRRGVNMLSSKLVKLLKQRDRCAHKIQGNFNVLTALLQAISQKRRVDTRIRFSFIPRPGKRGFRQWIDAVKAVARISHGIPTPWRKRVWMSLADFFLKDADWCSVKKACFNDRRNPDDEELDAQIVKDLHRTGCGWFFEHDTAEDRASLKRVLLAYARWNKSIGYCQGFNVIAALILQVMDGNEEHALKVMIFLIDYVLPRNYFANNLRALSVDMAVLRDLMLLKLPYLANHLQQLQSEAMDTSHNSAASYEPPLINMFTMQWFLTLFATCLPRDTVLRIWDSVLLEGSEVLLRVALAIWAKLGTYFDNVFTAADFYMKMGQLIQQLMTDEFIDLQKLTQTVYNMASFPWPELCELREKYTYDIHPFATFKGDKENKKKLTSVKPLSDEEETMPEKDDDVMIGCLGFVSSGAESPVKSKRLQDAKKKKPQSKTDITKVMPGAYVIDQDAQKAYKKQMKEKELLRESEKLDLSKLRNQYGRMRRLQQNAMLVFNNADFKEEALRVKSSPSAINHLFVDVNKVTGLKNRYRRPSNFPALKVAKQNSTSVKALKVNNTSSQTLAKSFVSTNDMPNRSKEEIDDDFSIARPYVAQEVQGVSDQLEASAITDKSTNSSVTSPFHDQISCNTWDEKENRGKQEPELMARKDKEHTGGESGLKSTSLLYQVDKTALYPSNFKPFPHRSNNRRKVLSGK